MAVFKLHALRQCLVLVDNEFEQALFHGWVDADKGIGSQTKETYALVELRDGRIELVALRKFLKFLDSDAEFAQLYWPEKNGAEEESVSSALNRLFEETIKDGKTEGAYQWKTKDGRTAHLMIKVEEEA